MVRLILFLSVIALYFNTPDTLSNAVGQLGIYKDYAFSFLIALLLTPRVIPWFE